MSVRYKFAPMVGAVIFIGVVIASIVFAASTAVAVAPVGAGVSAGGPTATPVCEVAWRAVAAPNPGPGVSVRGVASLGAADVWAVGDYDGGRQLLTMHWSGTQWNVVPNPNPGGNYANYLYAVSGVASNDVWAVGFYRQFSPNSLIMHWNGASWSYESGPYPGSVPWLYGVEAISANDVWAVGSQNNFNSLIYHYNGSAWSIVPSPNIGVLYGVGGTGPNDAWAVGTNGVLHWNGTQWSASGAVDLGAVRDVDALAPNDAWIVSDSGIQHWDGAQWSISHVGGGTSVEAIAGNDVWVTGTSSMLHWDGVEWSSVASPYGGMAGLSAVSASDIWAVGSGGGVSLTERYSFQCAVGTVTTTSTPTDTPVVTATPTCGPPAWNVTQSENPGADNSLLSMAATSATDIWAVGYHCDDDCGANPSRTLVQHWDGTQWSVVPSPNVGASSNSLLGVSATVTNNAWAVGSYLSGGVSRTLIMRWDGAQWSVVTSPNMGAGRNVLNGVSAISSTEAWAVGVYYNGTTGQTLTLRWSGSAWSIVTSPNVGTGTNILNDVSALPATGPWAVGNYYVGNRGQTLVLRWTGSAWVVVNSPNVGSEPNFLYGVSVVNGSDVWAVGYYFINGSDTRTLIEHWNGSEWSVVPSENVGQGANHLRGVAAFAADDIWAVGDYCEGDCGSVNPVRTLIQHWDGSEWSVVASPSVGSENNYLVGAVAVSAGETWAAGYYWNPGPGSFYETLALRRSGGGCATVTSTPSLTPNITPTGTRSPVTTASSTPLASGTATATATWTRTATGTPSRTPTSTGTVAVTDTPTPCPVSFSDVNPSDYFYDSVVYLYCREVISGYADETFRPYNNTTRGQLSKIVVLAEGWSLECPEPGHFSDVPPTHPFFCYIETAYARGIISGYADGTFRPYNDVTRGQLCKIVVLAEGWAEDCPEPGHFSDVPPAHPFYCYIETAFGYGVISGYADGTFRPYNNATRGQISKIVYEAVTGP